MRIHTDVLVYRDLLDAERIARVDADISVHGSRSRQRAFNVLLTGESRRRPNAGTSRHDRKEGQYAATWDQWGVFLAVLFERDPNMLTPYYEDADGFHRQTDDRFQPRIGPEVSPDGVQRTVTYWPADAHGDHTFKFTGTPYEQSCTKCSAITRWGR